MSSLCWRETIPAKQESHPWVVGGFEYQTIRLNSEVILVAFLKTAHYPPLTSLDHVTEAA
jgi:hypothetical protein